MDSSKRATVISRALSSLQERFRFSQAYDPLPTTSDNIQKRENVSAKQKKTSGKNNSCYLLLTLLLGNLILLPLRDVASNKVTWYKSAMAGTDLYGWIDERVNIREWTAWWKTPDNLGNLSLTEEIIRDDAMFAQTAMAWLHVWEGANFVAPGAKLPPPGHEGAVPEGVFYTVSSFHQLHCLTSLLRDWRAMIVGDGPEYGAQHISHCAAYIYQGILCSADATLEEVPMDTRSKAHVCNDFTNLREWLYSKERNSGLQYNGTHYVKVDRDYLAERVRIQYIDN